MGEIYEDYKNKVLFLDSLGLNSVIKREKPIEAETSANFKISLNEIIIIEEDEEEAIGGQIVPDLSVKTKLLSKSPKTSKSKDFTKGLRGRSKKLSMLDFSSPLGRKIDFSCGKANKNKSFLDCVNSYEKWCCNYGKLAAEEEQQKGLKNKSIKRGARGDKKYNFRKRSKRNNKRELSENSELLLHAMKPCSVVLSKIVENVVMTTTLKLNDCRYANHFELSKNVRERITPTVDNINTDSSEHSTEEEPLIEGVYSLAPGAFPHLPSRLLDLGKHLLKSLTSSPDTPQITADNSPPCTPPELNNPSDLMNRLNVELPVDDEKDHSEAAPCEGRNINIIDLCDVENEDCFMVDPLPKNVRTANGTAGQPLQQVTQCRIASGKVTNKDATNQRGDPRRLSFLCRICNEIIKCRGFYKADMVKHYAVKHNIANVNLVSHIHNGKLVWKVVEESSYFGDGSPLKCLKRRKENQSFLDADRQAKAAHPEATVAQVSVSERLPVAPERVIKVSTSAVGQNPLSSDVICID